MSTYRILVSVEYDTTPDDAGDRASEIVADIKRHIRRAYVRWNDEVKPVERTPGDDCGV